MADKTASGNAGDQKAVASEQRDERTALDDAIREAQQAFPEDEEIDDLDSEDVSSESTEDDESEAPAAAGDKGGAALVDQIEALKSEIAELKQSRSSLKEKSEEVADGDDFDIEIPEDWAGSSPMFKAMGEKMAKATARLEAKQEQLSAVIALVTFKQDFPDYSKHSAEMKKQLDSGRFNTGNYYEDLVAIYEHVTGAIAKKELARLKETSQAKRDSVSLGRVRPIKSGTDDGEPKGKLLTFAESYRNAVRTTVKAKAGRGR